MVQMHATNPMTAPLSKSLTQLLKGVSRSFYLTLRVLPGSIRPQIGLAYLLARTTDTIADTGILPIAARLEALRALRERILDPASAPLTLGELIRHQGLPAERLLLERHEDLISTLARFSPTDRQRVREVLATIISGQELDLRRFANASEQNVVALSTEAELDDYTYRVAGCVGEFWTRMCRAHLFPNLPLDEAALLANGIRFGKGLQLVNILRDVSTDLRAGRCYIPLDVLTAHQLNPTALLQPSSLPAFRPLYDKFLDLAQAHLAAGWVYTNSLPRACVRVRLACAWPILIGMKTLDQLRENHVLDPARRVKINRSEVRQLILVSILRYPWPTAWRRMFPGAV